MEERPDINPNAEESHKDDDVEKAESFELITQNQLELQLGKEKDRSRELLDQLQRVQAEFDNFRKRIDARFSEAAQYASEVILLKVLEVYDNLERALNADFSADPEAARRGISAITKQMESLFEKEGIRPIESMGTEFDPYYQHAVSAISDNELPDGIVVEVYQKGYMLKEKVLRPAVVVVNRHAIEANNEQQKPTESEGD
ncbi:MAG: nucleotide exchange factor GrpE [Candidatus Thorarchaeota archaeon]|nr:nucleotide exchange factor GrpE [Candidatus Thorarchaeota archaeon]